MSESPMDGQLILVPYSFSPEGYLPSDGRVFSVTGGDYEPDVINNIAMFTILGTQYGGSSCGYGSFALPNLPPVCPVGHDAHHPDGKCLHWVIATGGGGNMVYPQQADPEVKFFEPASYNSGAC
eukprot:CAMPEP_0119426090 /NCGR_PEP_ID=MMETSP1335-20130426/35686_1 /TAXON_ID=259385 /ORGANISM="Chrysoculter rhomboideus, Strain RCC1486" /LENGTH=123 /DNA_ID=CAMNT_0007451671 /DNA_START=64 /DNA_END=435 /DNA_ORIENTATION=+